jgi:ketosteroid isomerase-like protein
MLVARVELAELFNRFADALDTKDWSKLDGFYADDAVGEFVMDPVSPPIVLNGADAIVAFASAMIGSPEIVTQHILGNFSATIDGDTADARVYMRNHHAGVGPRAGQFQESIGTFSARFVRNGDGWLCTWWEERIFHHLGDGAELFAPEIAQSQG